MIIAVGHACVHICCTCAPEPPPVLCFAQCVCWTRRRAPAHSAQVHVGRVCRCRAFILTRDVEPTLDTHLEHILSGAPAEAPVRASARPHSRKAHAAQAAAQRATAHKGKVAVSLNCNSVVRSLSHCRNVKMAIAACDQAQYRPSVSGNADF